jgi:hypothetical protein
VVLVVVVTELLAHTLVVMVVLVVERLVLKVEAYHLQCPVVQVLLVKETMVVQTILMVVETVVVEAEQVLLVLLAQAV